LASVVGVSVFGGCIASHPGRKRCWKSFMTTRIEELSQAEHDLISEVHPQVGEIKEHVKT